MRIALSTERFESHRQTAFETDEIVFRRYQWNAELSECFYAALTVLEVTFRNGLSAAIAANFRNAEWLTRIPEWLEVAEQSYVEDGLNALASRQREVTQARMVQEMSFGFWASLLSRRYETKLFRHVAARAFPGMPRSLRTRDNVSRRIESIRKLRNRIFHFRRIWNRANILAEFDAILEAIDWINPQAQRMLLPDQSRARFIETLSRRP